MNLQTLETLEFEALREHLAGHAQSPLGRALALGIAPCADAQAIRRSLERTTEARRYLQERGRFGLGGLAEPEPLLDALRVAGTVLEAQDLLDVGRYISASLELKKAFADVDGDFAHLSSIVASMPDLKRTLAEIEAKILPTGEVDESASAELRRIRRDIQRLRGEVQRSLERLIRDKAGDAIQDELITIRNGRFVVPVRSDHKGKVKGVLHGSSSTGQTLYVEPLDTIDQNNELAALRDREEAEIAAILAALTDRVRADRGALEAVVDGLATLDLCAAQAHLSREFDCVAPELRDDGVLELDRARHLLLERNLKRSGLEVVPMTMTLDASHRVVVISGPNAGGKTVVLKTVGLCVLLAQSGLHVPAASAAIPIFDEVLVDIGDHQSLAANLSTFSAHIRNIASMVDDLPRRALVLLDEIGTGTDPDEGGALAIAILERLRTAGAYVVATTHYNRLKMYAANTDGVANAAVEFDEKTLEPTYRLIEGLAGSSSGIEIARRIGLDSEVVDVARRMMTVTDLEAADYLRRLKAAADEARELRAALDDEREAVARRYAELDHEFAKRDKDRTREFARALEQVVEEFEVEGRRMVERATDKTQQARLRKAVDAGAARMRGEARTRVAALTASGAGPANAAAAAPRLAGGPIEVGVDVFVPKMGQRGTVEAIDGGRVDVRMGMLKLRVGVNEVERIDEPVAEPAATRLPAGVRVELASDEMVPAELNLIGRHTDEAADMLDKFLDAAFLGSLPRVRIIHGFGTGALKRAVAALLARHPHVANFGPAPSNEGGGGATVVELRR